jgi:hypothetical protein
MPPLASDWVTQGLIDFEYKKYLLLAYLKDVAAHFDEDKLYPLLSDLVAHFRNLDALKKRQEETAEQFPKRLSKLDLEAMTIDYERMVQDGGCMETIRQIVDFAIPRIQTELGRGKELYDRVEAQMRIEPIGIVPVDTNDGYFFLHSEQETETRVYRYTISLFEHGEARYRGIRTRELHRRKLSLIQTFEAIKLDLVQRFRERPNPATWLVQSNLYWPVQETFLSLVRHLAALSGEGPPATA